MRLVAVLGSATAPGRLHRAVTEALEWVEHGRDASAELIDLAVARIGAADGRPPEGLDDVTAATIAAIAAADAVLLATPVYRGSLKGTLKNLLDHVPVEALRDTPVAIVAMGVSEHHYLGAERHLRDILAFFGALVAPTAVYLSSRDFEDGVPSGGAAAALDAVIATVLALAAAGMGTLGPDPLAARGR